MPKEAFWTEKQLETLKKWYPKISSLDKLCKKLGYSRNHIAYKAQCLGLKRGKGKHNSKLSEFQIKWMVAHFEEYTNAEFAKRFKCDISCVRKHLHARKLYRMELYYWTDEQVQYLKDNYKTTGDKQLAIDFNKLWPDKPKGWTLKHMEKKRKYLKLVRSNHDLQNVRRRNMANGFWWNMGTWKTRGACPEGTIRIQIMRDCNTGMPNPYKVIKIGNKFIPYARYLYEQEIGPIPEGHVIGFKDMDNMNVVASNLVAVSRAEHAIRNRTKLTPELRTLNDLLKQLNSKIKEYEQSI